MEDKNKPKKKLVKKKKVIEEPKAEDTSSVSNGDESKPVSIHNPTPKTRQSKRKILSFKATVGDTTYDIVEERTSVGRPASITPDIALLLLEAFKIGCTDAEACDYAGIKGKPVASTTFYKYCQENPDFRAKKEFLKNNGVLKAKNTIFMSLSDPMFARWYLEKKCRKEFGTEIDINLKQGQQIDLSSLSRDEIKALAEQALQQRTEG